jgi:hypothetical protein
MLPSEYPPERIHVIPLGMTVAGRSAQQGRLIEHFDTLNPYHRLRGSDF